MAQSHPPKPRLTLRIGITGKRALPIAQRDDIQAALDHVIDALAELLARCQSEQRDVWAEAPPLLRIVSGLAEGADQIGAQLMLAKPNRVTPAGKVETSVAAILPFPTAEFLEDFRTDPNTGAARDNDAYDQVAQRFERLLREASKDAVLEIDDEASHQDRNNGYAALRDILLEHSDLLIALSDDKDGGAGGTVDVIRTALREQVPVIKIATTTSGKVHLLKAPQPDDVEQTSQEADPIAPGQPLPAALVTALKLIFEPPPASGHEPHHAPRSGRTRLQDYLAEEFRPAWFGRLFKAFRDTLSVPEQRSGWLLALGQLGRSFRDYAVKTPSESASSITRGGLSSLLPENTRDRFSEIHAERQAWADALSIAYADATRSSYVAIASLGAAAVLIGLLALFPQNETASVFAKMTALIAEGAILITVGVVFFGPAHRGNWHERMVEYRALAELLRQQRFVYALGGADRLERTADRTWREPDAWVGWYVRATMRELGFPSATLTADYRRRMMELFRHEEVEEQQDYNKTVASRYNTLDQRLGRLVERAWVATIYLAGGGALLIAALFAFEHYHWPGHTVAAELLHIAKPLLTLLMAFIPACIAAIHGIRFQMEFRNTAERAARTEHELAQIAAGLESMGPAPGRRYSLFYVRAANDAMSSDLAGWSNVHWGKAPEPP